MTGREWGDWFCQRLDVAIARETPGGLGAWPGAWEAVKEPSGALLAELMEIDRGRGDKEAAKRLGVEVLVAWRRAGVKWQNTEGRAA
jgi:hypothetical protein